MYMYIQLSSNILSSKLQINATYSDARSVSSAWEWSGVHACTWSDTCTHTFVLCTCVLGEWVLGASMVNVLHAYVVAVCIVCEFALCVSVLYVNVSLYCV